MSTDRIVYTGAYLDVGKIKVKYEMTINGCPNCKTGNNRNKFCSSCGHEHVDYQKPAQASSFNELLDVASSNGIIDDAEYDDIIDTFFTDYTFIMPEGGPENVGQTHWVGYETLEFQMPVVDNIAAQAFFQPVLTLLDHFGIKYEMKTGILYYCR